MQVTRSLRTIGILGIVMMMTPSLALAVPSGTLKAGRPSEAESLKYRYEMNLDVSAVYVRDTRPIGGSDTGARVNLGGMFTNWIGLEATGMFEIKSKSFLAGGTIKLMPIDWFFLKAGGGAYSDKTSGELKPTPMLGTGLVGRFSEYWYMLAEGTYFQSSNNARNIGIGVGLGTIF